jgi:aconitate hydratase
MGVLPLEFRKGESRETLGLTGSETFDIEVLGKPGQELSVIARGKRPVEFTVIARIDNSVEMDYYRGGGILQTLVRRMGS